MAKQASDQAIGKQNAQRVGEWVDSVAPQDVPTNQFGRPSVEKILTEILGLKKSARYNVEIKAHFERLAERLKSPEAKASIQASGSSEADQELIRELKETLEKREKRITTLENTITGLKQEIKAGQHAVETGRLVRR
ncbi:MAG: hypothetical protein ABW086_16490 [Sedimenticola sp.]